MEKVKTIQYDIPYTYENSSNPWLMGSKDSETKDKKILTINGNKITSEYMWSLNAEERNKLLKDVFEYYRDKGYIFNCNDVIEVDISDLPPQSNYRVLVKCECCGKEYYMPYYTFYKCGGVVCCKSCKYSKLRGRN